MRSLRCSADEHAKVIVFLCIRRDGQLCLVVMPTRNKCLAGHGEARAEKPRNYTDPRHYRPVKIFIEESGDPGFTERASQYFIIAALIVHNPLAIRRCFAKIRRNKRRKKYRELPGFMFNNNGMEIKTRGMSCIASADVDIACCVLRKEHVYLHLRSNHRIICNYLTGSLISYILQRFSAGGDVDIIIDKSLNGIQREAQQPVIIFGRYYYDLARLKEYARRG